MDCWTVRVRGRSEGMSGADSGQRQMTEDTGWNERARSIPSPAEHGRDGSRRDSHLAETSQGKLGNRLERSRIVISCTPGLRRRHMWSPSAARRGSPLTYLLRIGRKDGNRGKRPLATDESQDSPTQHCPAAAGAGVTVHHLGTYIHTDRQNLLARQPTNLNPPGFSQGFPQPCPTTGRILLRH